MVSMVSTPEQLKKELLRSGFHVGLRRAQCEDPEDESVDDATE